MSDHDENNDEKHDQPKKPEVFTDTYYDDEDVKADFGDSWDSDEKDCAGQRMADQVISKMPYDVLKHLNNGSKEFVKAGMAFGEATLKEADRWMNRVDDLHHRHGDHDEEPEIITNPK